MKIGIVAKTFARASLAETLDAVVSHGMDCIQFNFTCVGLPLLPERIELSLLDSIRQELARRRIRLAAVSGICNLIHPDPVERRNGLRRFRTLAQACRRLGAPIITLCTGTRDPHDPWRWHPDNALPEAWQDLRASLAEILPLAQEHNLVLAFEPEAANVVDSAQKGRQLLDEVRSPRLKVVMDAANLFHPGQLSRMREMLDEAFHLLGGGYRVGPRQGHPARRSWPRARRQRGARFRPLPRFASHHRPGPAVDPSYPGRTRGARLRRLPPLQIERRKGPGFRFPASHLNAAQNIPTNYACQMGLGW